MSISQFTSQFKDLARTNRYEIDIPGICNIEESTLCTSVGLGGSTLSTTEQRGLKSSHYVVLPYDSINENITMSFYIDTEFNLYKKFNKWVNDIYNSNTNEFSYRNTYVKTISVKVLDRTDKPIYSYEFIDAYPLSIKEPTLTSSEQNNFATFDITFDYNKRK